MQSSLAIGLAASATFWILTLLLIGLREGTRHEDIRKAFWKGYDEGFENGREIGREDGFEEGRDEFGGDE